MRISQGVHEKQGMANRVSRLKIWLLIYLTIRSLVFFSFFLPFCFHIFEKTGWIFIKEIAYCCPTGDTT